MPSVSATILSTRLAFACQALIGLSGPEMAEVWRSASDAPQLVARLVAPVPSPRKRQSGQMGCMLSMSAR